MTSRQQYIRNQATHFRRAFAAASGLPDAPLLPLEAAAERLLLSVFDDPSLAADVNGEFNPQLGSIRLRPGLRPTRRRFVIAHELGHATLEAATPQPFSDDDSTLDELANSDFEQEAGVLRAYNTRERAEREANLFAIELLVPAPMLRTALLTPGWQLETLAQQFGVSPDALRGQIVNVCCIAPVQTKPVALSRPATNPPDTSQQAAIDAPLPTLVVAGPGTGKTRTIVAKYAALIEQGVDPANILALTFSNKAAEELRERIVAALEGETPEHGNTEVWEYGDSATSPQRIDVSTFHAWGLNFLRMFGQQLDLPLDARLRSAADVYVLLRSRLDDLPLVAYKDLREPGQYLRQIIGAISRAKDTLIDPASFAALAEAEAVRLQTEAEAEFGGKTTKTALRERERASRDAARLRELAAVYASYSTLLREEHTLDYGDLIAFAVAALRIPEVAAAAHRQYHYILVDEFQDMNDASGELLRLLDGGRGRLWAVGDPWQSIYRFRGASPANIQRFSADYPGATLAELRRNYRSRQSILAASHAIMAADPLAAQRPGLLADRGGGGSVCEWVCADAASEAAAIVADIERRSGLRRFIVQRRSRKTAAHRRVFSSPSLRVFRSRKHAHLGDHAILCRTHAQAEQIAAALRARNVPVDLAGDLFDETAVKDALALLGMGQGEAIATLRALTLPGYTLDLTDLAVVFQGYAEGRNAPVPIPTTGAALPPWLLAAQPALSAEGQTRLAALAKLASDLAQSGDAWQALVRYGFERPAAQAELAAALAGDQAAQRTLAALGQLVLLARSFVRNAPEGQRGPADFLRYLRTLREGGERIAVAVPALGADVVRVMTIHAAKGLEFPCVYVPGVQEGIFPARKQYGSIPALPALARDGDEMAEERYLLYVAMTRARDRLVLTRAATKREKPVRRSPLLPGDETGTGAIWPVYHVRASTAAPGNGGERLDQAARDLAHVSASGIETYERCARQFFYHYGFGLEERGEGAYLRMHQAIRTVSDELTRRAATSTLPADAAGVSEVVREAFRAYRMGGVLYEADYAAEATAQATRLWQELRANAAPISSSKPYTVSLPSGSISISIDRIEQGEHGPRFVRTRSGKPRDGDHLSTRVALYSLAQQQHGAGEVFLDYAASGERRAVLHKPAALSERAAAIDALLQRIAQGDWTPSFGSQCATCPFVLICPV